MDFHAVFVAAKRGDASARAQLLEEMLPGLRAFVRLQGDSNLRAKESCSDLVQSVCRQVLEDIGSVRENTEAGFRHWLFAVARNKILNKVRYYRAERRDAGREVPLAAQASGYDGQAALLDSYGSLCTPSRHAIAREELERTELAFDELPEDYRKVIVLVRIVGLSHAEAARELGRTEKATRQLLSRAIGRLVMLLRPEDRE